LAPVNAHAHLVSTRFGDFYGGMLHLCLTLEHALPMVALGLLAGLQAPRTGRWILVAVPLGLLCGVLLAMAVPDLAPLVWANQASFVIPGLLIAAAWRLPMAALVGLGWLFGLSHGYGNGLAISAETNAYLFALGVLACGFVLLALVAAATVAWTQRATWAAIAVRAVGSWIAAIGLMVAVV
jgi:hydrogenase/urease accessory protein HupE